MDSLFEWDPVKASANLRKHGVSFLAAARIFDGLIMERPDDREDYGEERIAALEWSTERCCMSSTHGAAKRGALSRRGRPKRTSAASTVRYSRADLPADDTDWQRVDALTDEEVHAAALADPDARTATPEFWRDARVVHPVPKDSITIRVDRDVVEWFRSEGRGYQTRINAVLRAFVDRQRTRTD